MEEKTTIPTPGSEEIDLKDLIVQLWKKRKFILMVTGLFLLLGIFVAFTSPVSYTASCTVVPQTGQKGGSNLGGLASMMGVNLGSAMSSETLSPTVYPHIVKSAPFCKEIMGTPIIVKKSPVPITLYEYYTDKKYQSKSILNGIKKYTLGLPGTILLAIRPDKTDDNTTVHTDTLTGKIITLSAEEKKVYDVINANIQFESNPKDGYIKLGYTFPEPEAVAVISQQLYNVLERYVKNFKAEKELDNLKFVESSYQEARKDFLQKQANLAAFQDSNRSLSTATARSTERRLSSEYDIAFTIYNELAKQREQSKLAVKESTPIFTIIDPVVVPRQNSAPKRGIIIAMFSFLGLILSSSYLIISPLFKNVAINI